MNVEKLIIEFLQDLAHQNISEEAFSHQVRCVLKINMEMSRYLPAS